MARADFPAPHYALTKQRHRGSGQRRDQCHPSLHFDESGEQRHRAKAGPCGPTVDVNTSTRRPIRRPAVSHPFEPCDRPAPVRSAVASPDPERNLKPMSVGETTITVVGNLTADPDLRFLPAGA